jgi:uncharacterized membrane protein YbhN (UPF0104 family)
MAVLILAAVIWSVGSNWAQVSDDLRRVPPGTLALALALGFAAPVLTMMGWRRLLADLGTTLPVPPAAGIFFVGQLGKFVPGSVWSVLAQAEMGARLNVPRRRTAVVGVVSVVLSLATGLAIGIPALPVLLRGEDSRAVAVAALAVIPLLVIGLHPWVLNGVLARVLTRLRREPLEHPLTGAAILAMTAWFLAAWLCAGLSVTVLIGSLAPSASTGQRLLAGVAGFALASAGGMLAVLFPAGVGVRDGLLLLMLEKLMPLPTAMAIAVLARFITTLADVVLAGIGWVWARAHHLLGQRA